MPLSLNIYYYLMKLIIYSVLAYSLLLSITCLVNSDQTNFEELKQK